MTTINQNKNEWYHSGVCLPNCTCSNKTLSDRPTQNDYEVALKSSQGVKADTGKPPMELLSPIALIGISEVLAFGAKKYAANNWRKGLAWGRVIGAIMRHLMAIMKGEDKDPETGLLHVDHLACEVMFLQEFFRTRPDLDDRFKVAPLTAEATAQSNSGESK